MLPDEKTISVKLNIGGQVFVTQRGTLSEKDTIFDSLRDQFEQFDGVLELYYDRDPRYFAPILNYLRTGKVILDDGVSVEGVLEEARFFRVQPVIDDLTARIAAKAKTDLTRDQIVWVSSTSDRRSFRGLRLNGVDLSLLDLMGSNFCKAKLKGAIFDNTDLIHARFQDADLEGASFRNAHLPYAVFQGANCKDVDFTGANLHGARFQEACLINCKFADSIINKAKFNDANLEGAQNIAVHDLGIVGHMDYKGAVPMPLISVTDNDPGYLTD